MPPPCRLPRPGQPTAPSAASPGGRSPSTRSRFSRATGHEAHQGYPGRMHGGVITGILDETIGHAINIGEGENPMTWGVTAELTVRFRKPVPLDVELTARGRITATFTTSLKVQARSTCPMASSPPTAHGKYIRLKLDTIAGSEPADLGWRVYEMKGVMEQPLAHRFYAQMTLIRRTEETFFDLYAQGLMAGTVHTSIGQEATARWRHQCAGPARAM